MAGIDTRRGRDDGEQPHGRDRPGHGHVIPSAGAGPPVQAALPHQRISRGYPLTFGQVLLIQSYVRVGSACGHPGGAVMFRIGIVMTLAGSRVWNG